MLTDGYGYVLNGKATYIDIAEKLRNRLPVIICWTDELGWCENILFTFGTYQQKEPLNILTGYHAMQPIENMLFVATDTGFAGFDVNENVISESYIAEKLKRHTGNITTERLSVLINNIKHTLHNMIIDPKAYDFDFKFKKMEVEEDG